MPDQERENFEARLQNEPQFKLLVDDIKALILGIENQSLKEQLDTFHKDIPETTSESTTGFFSLRKLAAAAVILFAISGFWWFNTPQHERLYSSYFSPDPGLPTTMSSDSNFEFYDAMVDYKQGNYNEAIKKWEVLKTKTPHNDTLNYFLGVAYLANKDETTAIPFLEKSLSDQSFSLSNDAYYYLALAHLKDGDIDLAKTYLKKSSLEKSEALLSELLD